MDNQKRHLLIFFKTGGVVKIEDLPEGFDFGNWCLTARALGYVMNGVMYIPHEAINGMAWVRSDNDMQWAPNDGKRTTLQ